ncbi:MAG: hypothetical protein P4L85_04025 [Paludisphaera borealis]|uniref:hypothetical protein n=1 Tax=Paludisphaera borealis TaxID=1387353 RepID=UPI002842B332|nr:hypothetical protein [Paludisphaera borealis]MDR3618495.1 hypothetical protein [Paludisphaera borealis]
MSAIQATGGELTRVEDSEAIGPIPKELAILFLVAGVGGVLLPGPIGTPFLIIGAVALWPQLLEAADREVRERFPRVHHCGVRQVKRFVADLERRYP